MEYTMQPQGGGAAYMDEPVGRPVTNSEDALSVDPNFEIADLPVKLELRYVIESKRVASGLDVPTFDLRTKEKKTELTPEEENRRRIRRERNKLAASKCRKKRKDHVRNLLQQSEELESANSVLESEIAYLKAERDQLEKMLDAHKCSLGAGTSRGPA